MHKHIGLESVIRLGTDNKLRPLYLLKLLYEHTDENHPLSTGEIVRLLDVKYGVTTQRLHIPKDIELLEQFGYEIGRIRGQAVSYFFDQRLFELPELKLLIDAVESSSFITEKKSTELIQKLTSLASPYKASALAKISEVGGNPKQGNEQIYYIIDTINAAIESGCKISYQYYTYDMFKNRVLRHNGEKYVFSPYDLAWDGKFYYAIGYSEKYHSVSNIRIDRIAHTPEIMAEPGRPLPEGFDLNEYKRTMFRMFNGERMTVELVCDASVMDAIIDHFGEDVDIGLVDENTFSVSAETSVSHVFYSWLFGFGGKVRLTEPREAVEQYADMVLEAAKSLHEQL